MIAKFQLHIIALTSLIIAFIIGQGISIPRVEIRKQDSSYNFNGQLLCTASVGFKRLISDILWIQTLLESDLEHYTKRDLSSWLYLRFNTISQLDPMFYENYLYGGEYLMIVKDDLAGSESLLLKGLKLYPNDLYLNYYLGYLYAIELSDSKRSFPYFAKIRHHPDRPMFFDTLFSKVAASTLDLNVALQMVKDLYHRQIKESPTKERLYHQIYSIQFKIDDDCRINRGLNCNLKDIDGVAYKIDSQNKLISNRPVLEMKLKIKRPSEEGP
jgi:hypothetical protein